jgi:hypothetical protein
MAEEGRSVRVPTKEKGSIITNYPVINRLCVCVFAMAELPETEPQTRVMRQARAATISSATVRKERRDS